MTNDFNNIFDTMFGNIKYSNNSCTSCPYSLLPAKIKRIKSKMINIKKTALNANTKEKYNQIIVDGFAAIYKLLWKN